MPGQQRILVAIAALLLATPVMAQTAKQKDALASALNASYSFTTSKDTGSVYAVRVGGFSMSSDPMTYEPEYTIRSTRPLRTHLATVFATLGQHTTREVKAGEAFYLTSVDVDQNYLRFHLRSVDLHTVVERGRSYREQFALALKFPLAHGAIANMTAADVHAMVDPILSPGSGDSQRIHLGQSPEEVADRLGAPTREIALDHKRILVFHDIKVAFVDDKVADIQ